MTTIENTELKELDKLLNRYLRVINTTEKEEENKIEGNIDIVTYMKKKQIDVTKELEGKPIANTEMISDERGTEVTVDTNSLRLVKEDEEEERE